ncbi:DUF938 domain-containing protein [Sneathiella glossodoripedis]|uniref:DUF938 domain-containing protein n=1 Tax=Sneathiella glossodoripedis TaxID=418853 RepID=UPI00046F1F26|nr:DUF938 domain-containing protein [Sneathiella glossodoripedis]
MNDDRQFAPAVARNQGPILQQLTKLLHSGDRVMEIASGTGEHGVYFSQHLPEIIWQPTNLEPDHLRSASAWQKHAGLENLLPVLGLDATSTHWPVEEADYQYGPFSAIFNANMIHISPWFVTEGLMHGAGRVLQSGGRLILYGPYKIDGKHTAPSNIEFDNWLKEKDERFGVRDLADISAVAENNGLVHKQSIPMPANNFIQLFEKS